MKPRLQSSLLLIATLVIGVILGALLQSKLSEHRFNRATMLRNEENFIEALESAIQPVDAAQQGAVRQVIEEAAPRIIAQVKQNREQLRHELVQVRTDLEPLLDEEQLARLEARLYPAPRRKPGAGK